MTKTKHTTMGTLNGATFTLTAAASRTWGAYEADGVDSPEAAKFRTELRRELRGVAQQTGRNIEVFAVGEPVGSQSWVLDVVEG